MVEENNLEQNNLEQNNVLLFDDCAKVDLLDYESYSDTLSTLIKNFPSDNSLTIGIFGDWGSGKTTLLDMINGNLQKDDFKSIWVDSWYIGNNDEEIWKTFLQSILLYVKRELTFFEKIGFHISLIKKNKLWEKFPNVLFKTGIIAAIFYFVFSSVNWGEEVFLKNLLSHISAVIGIWWALKPIVNEFNEKVNVDIQGMSHASTLLRKASANDEFKNSFESMVKILTKKKRKVVFIIDDLDRCYPDQIPQILDTFRRFLNFPNCVYILGMDRRIVEEAMISRFPNFSNPRIEARKYLEKLITLPFDLPPLSSDQMDTLVAGLDINLPDYELCKKIFTLGQEANPRKVKRTINVFLLLWTLVNNRPELRNEINPIRLAKIVVIQHNYRDLYSIININPNYLGELEYYFRSEDIFNDSQSKMEKLKIEIAPLLIDFIDDINLKRLLCIHELEDEDFNFVFFQDDLMHIVDDSIVQPYLQLTKTISSSSMEFSSHSLKDFSSEFITLQQMMKEDTNYRLFILYGPNKSGKTSLVKRLLEFYIGNQQTMIYIDLLKLTNPKSITYSLKNQLGIMEDFNTMEEYDIIDSILSMNGAYVATINLIVFDHFEKANNATKKWIRNLIKRHLSQKLNSKHLVIGIVTNNLNSIQKVIVNHNNVKRIFLTNNQFYYDEKQINEKFDSPYQNINKVLHDYMNNPNDEDGKG